MLYLHNSRMGAPGHMGRNSPATLDLQRRRQVGTAPRVRTSTPQPAAAQRLRVSSLEARQALGRSAWVGRLQENLRPLVPPQKDFTASVVMEYTYYP